MPIHAYDEPITTQGEAERIELAPPWSARWPYLLLLPVLIAVAVAPVLIEGTPLAPASAILASVFGMGWLLGWVALGARTIVVDSAGIEQRWLFGRSRVSWRDVTEYRYRPQRPRRTSTHALDLLRFLDLVLSPVIGPPSPRLRVAGARTSVTIDAAVYGREGERAIARVLGKVDATIRARIKRELAETGIATFGPLMMSREAVAWGNREPVAREQVESIELFETEPVQLRVMVRDKAWPYGRASVERVPNALAALATARALGYRVPDPR